jgi:hypothetical protein
MVIKEKFELIYRGSDEVYNIVPLSKSTIRAYEIDKEDKEHLQMLGKSFSRIKKHPSSDIVDANMKDVVFVKLPIYPLPGFVTKDGLAVANLSVIPVTLITDYTTSDIYSLLLYAISLKQYIVKKPFSPGNEINIANMIFSIFMKLFGKKSGLIGSFKHLIPKLQFLIFLYVSVSFMGFEQTNTLIKKIGTTLYMNPDELKLDGYDFRRVRDFLAAINDNEIISISENKFSSQIVATAGMSSLPMFEDISRFFATILVSDIPGTTQFSGFWSKVNTALFQKLVYIGLSNLKLKGK